MKPRGNAMRFLISVISAISVWRILLVLTERVKGLELSGGTIIMAEGGRISGEVVVVQEVYRYAEIG